MHSSTLLPSNSRMHGKASLLCTSAIHTQSDGDDFQPYFENVADILPTPNIIARTNPKSLCTINTWTPPAWLSRHFPIRIDACGILDGGTNHTHEELHPCTLKQQGCWQ